MGAWASLFLCGIVLWFGSNLPNLDLLAQLPRRPSVRLLDQRGQILASYGDFYGAPIRMEDLPPHVVQALLAIEDRRFFHHYGVDPVGIVRAFVRNLRSGRIMQGGSTITQQLAKNFLQSQKVYSYRDRSIQRKISEALLALQIERRFTKNQILTMHLNRVYMGAGTWGIDAAALKYFDRNAKDLGLYEAAILIGLLQAPSHLSPARSQERSEVRAKRVLQAMVESGNISQEAALAAMAIPTPLAPGVRQHSAYYFTDWVMDQLHELVDSNAEDLDVKTTLDLTLQRIAERHAKQVMATRGALWKAKQTALIAMTPDGGIQAMVGGLNHRQSPFNRATQAIRQPGSIFKYFVFLAALEEGYTPDSWISDVPIRLGSWKAPNFNKYKSQGEITLREAFAKSVNASAIRLTMDVGITKVIEMARRLGVQSAIPQSSRNYTIALGTAGFTLLEMTGAFAAMVNHGMKVTPYGIQEVVTRGGKVLYRYSAGPKKAVLDGEVLREMQSLLREVIESGTGRTAKIPSVSIMGKTGTSNKKTDDRDVWFIGMTPQMITGVWSGCDDEAPMKRHPGGSPSLHLWKDFTTTLLQYLRHPDLPTWNVEDLPLEEPSSIKAPIIQKKDSTKKSKEEENGDKEDEDEETEDEEDDDEDEDEEDDNVPPKAENQGRTTPKKSVEKPLDDHSSEEKQNLIDEILQNIR